MPAIITNYSGPATFVNEENGYPIKVSHVRRNGQAEPDLKDVQRLMKHVYENPQDARQKGIQCVSILFLLPETPSALTSWIEIDDNLPFCFAICVLLAFATALLRRARKHVLENYHPHMVAETVLQHIEAALFLKYE